MEVCLTSNNLQPACLRKFEVVCTQASLIIALLEVMVCVRHRSSGGIPFLSQLNYEDFTLIEMTISQNAWTSFIFVRAGVFTIHIFLTKPNFMWL